MGPVSRVAPFGLRFRRKRKSAIGLRGSAGAKPMVEPMELWQRLGHASYRDWVLAAQRARRVTIAAKKAAVLGDQPVRFTGDLQEQSPQAGDHRITRLEERIKLLEQALSLVMETQTKLMRG